MRDEHLAGGEAAADGVNDRGEVHRHGERQHRGAGALGDEQDAAVMRCRRNARCTIARFRPAIA